MQIVRWPYRPSSSLFSVAMTAVAFIATACSSPPSLSLARGQEPNPGCAQAFGPGMMGYGYGGMGRGMMGPQDGWTGGSPSGEPLSFDQAIEAARGYVDRLGNPDLELEEGMAFACNYYFIVEERSTGIGAFELLVDPTSGAVYPEPGPNMMWNTKYGQMGSMMGGRYVPALPTENPTLSPTDAQRIARQWLDEHQPGTTTEHPDAFYGYYTLHTLKEGSVNGMLSVNAYTGQVWYQVWHGDFVSMRELENQDP